MKLDNLRFISDASSKEALDFSLDFDLPDGSLIEDLNLPEKAEWKPYIKEENSIIKLMLHGMTGDNVEDLVPLAKSWAHPAKLTVEGNEFLNQGYDPTQMAYVIEQKSGSTQSLTFNLEADKDSPMVNPAFVIKHWGKNNIEGQIRC